MRSFPGTSGPTLGTFFLKIEQSYFLKLGQLSTKPMAARRFSPQAPLFRQRWLPERGRHHPIIGAYVQLVSGQELLFRQAMLAFRDFQAITRFLQKSFGRSVGD
jgi:hypothetical protein